MHWRNWEAWMFAITVATAIVSVLALSESRAPGFVSQAIAGERHSPAYTITVTAKRLPAECKGAVDTATAARCDAIRDTTTVVATAIN
jgi:hypothetical protein